MGCFHILEDASVLFFLWSGGSFGKEVSSSISRGFCRSGERVSIWGIVKSVGF